MRTFGVTRSRAPIEIALLLDAALQLATALGVALLDIGGNRRLLRAAAAHALGEPFDRAAVHPRLAEILPRHA